MSDGVPENRSKTKSISLVEMRAGQSGKIVEIERGHGLARKLDAMGIREGQKITKVSAQLMRGPVLLKRNNTQIAIGFGMAGRVFVEPSPPGAKK